MSTGWRHASLWTFTTLVIGGLLAPIFVVVLYSFNSSRSLTSFTGFSLRWYEDFLNNEVLRASLWTSIKLAVATVILATILGTLLAFGLVRWRGRGSGSANIMMLLPMIMPEIILGVSLLLLFSQIFLWESSFRTLVIAHVTFSLSYVTIMVRSRLASMGPDLEEAAQDLGASPLKAVGLVTLPNLWPAILGAMLLCFALSFDDFTVSLFTSGVGDQPLPVRIYSMVKFGVSPTINAIGTTLFVLSLLALVLLVVMLRTVGREERRQGEAASSLGSMGDVI